MAVPTNTLVQSAQVGVREDLEDTIYRVAAEDTPFTNQIGKVSIKNTLHEWQIEDLATPDPDNAQLDGDDAAIDAAHQPDRVGVYAQIFRKTGAVSGTAEALDTAGRESEMDKQKTIKGIELRRDMEARMIGAKASRAQSGSNARWTAGALAWIEDHDSLGDSGASGGWDSGGVVTAPTNGTQRAFSEAQIKAVLASAFSNGARMSICYVSPTHKQEFSAFSGIAATRVQTSQAKQTKIIAAADVYVSDFGNISVVPVQYGLTRDALLIDPSGWKVGTLRGMTSETLAKTGDNEKFMNICEKALICTNQRKGAAVRDLT